MITKAFPLLTLILFAASASAAEITVLGLPLGGKLVPPPKVCRGEAPEQHLCWTRKPFVASEGSTLGNVRLPRTDNLPAWAANATFDLTITPAGALGKIAVRTYSADDGERITQSIASRFGPPTSALLRSNEWVRADINIHLICDHSIGCNVEFESAGAYAERMRQVAERQKKDAARPVAP